MDSSFWAVLLLFIALALLFAEVLIPSGGLILFASTVCLFGAIWSAWEAWWGTNPILWWAFCLSVIILLPTSVGAAIYVWPYTPIGRASEPPTHAEVTPYAEEQQRLRQLVGQLGETVTPLTPSGFLRVQGQRIHCQSEGTIVPAGATVRVLAVRGNGLLVREVSEPQPGVETASAASDPVTPGATADARTVFPLDFDIPAGSDS